MSEELENLKAKLEQEVILQVKFGTFNTFANIVEQACGKEKADEFRKAAIKEGKWIKMDGVIYNRD